MVTMFTNTSCRVYGSVHASDVCKFMVPKRRFWKDEQTFGNVFSKHFSHTWVLDLGSFIWKVLWKYVPECLLGLPKSSFGDHETRFAPSCIFKPCSDDVRIAIRRFYDILNLWSPNDDFVRSNKHFGPCFETTFHIREYFIWATDQWPFKSAVKKRSEMFVQP